MNTVTARPRPEPLIALDERRYAGGAVRRFRRRRSRAHGIAEQEQRVSADQVNALRTLLRDARATYHQRSDQARRRVERRVWPHAARRAARGIEKECQNDRDGQRPQRARNGGAGGAAEAILNECERGAGGDGEEPD